MDFKIATKIVLQIVSLLMFWRTVKEENHEKATKSGICALYLLISSIT